jgi:Na+-transporting methylmalonyl-CoA/oxaloacetate decarboxylase gamma subunit
MIQFRALDPGGTQVQGLAAITAHNGWAMAGTGACIVILGLAMLSFIISQLHRIIGLIEKRQAPVPAQAPEVKAPAPAVTDDAHGQVLSDLEATARRILPFTQPLGDAFKLADLYKAMNDAKMPHPHITVRELKDAGFLAPAGKGNFHWK